MIGNTEILNASIILGAVITLCIMLVLMISFGMALAWGTHHGDNHPTEKGCNSKTLKQYAEKVDDMICKQDDVDKDKILSFPDVNSKEEKCINHRADLGNELYEDEIMKCYLKNN